MRFRDIPQFISDGSYQVNMSWEYLIEWLDQRVKEEGLQLNPDFQRGHVWTEEQQIKFLEFILQGGKTGRTLYFNDPYWHSVRPKTGYADFVCVDGLQRITAIQRFMNDEIRVFGLLHSEYEIIVIVLGIVFLIVNLITLILVFLVGAKYDLLYWRYSW